MTSPERACPEPPLRRWKIDDVDSLVELANEWDIARNLRDAFPHPYTRDAAEAFTARAASGEIGHLYAISVEGRAVGGCGLKPKEDIERCSAEIGYWLGKPYWGRGLATAAVRSLTQFAFEHLGLARVFALPFEENLASVRVLEKAGFIREGVLRNAAIKEGRVRNMFMYAAVPGDLGSGIHHASEHDSIPKHSS